MLRFTIKPVALIVFILLTTAGCSRTTQIDWQYSADLNRDGSAETVRVLDLNGNSRPDKIGDLHIFGQGEKLQGWLWAEAEFGVDKEPDELRIYIDRNKDGRIDIAEGWHWRYLDLDDDGICNDEDSDLHEWDMTGKGFVHQRIRYRDIDGDGDADLRCDYPALFPTSGDYLYITSNRCMRRTWRGSLYGFGWEMHWDEDDDNNLRWDADGAGATIFHVRRPQEPMGIGDEGRHSTGEGHRWYDFNGDGFTDMHLRDYGPGVMRWSFDFDGDAPRKYSLDEPVEQWDAHVDYDVAFHTLGEVPRDYWAGDQLKLWEFLVGFDLPGYYRQPGTAFDFGRDFVPSDSSVYYTLHAPWQIISFNWLEDTEDDARTKDVSCHRVEGIWSYYYDFDPNTAFIGSRRDFDRDADSDFRLYLSPIDGRYHLYEAEDGIWYRDTDCRRPHFMLRPTPENIKNYVREIITYSYTDNDGFYDTFSYDRDLDGTPEEVISKPDADRAPITDMTEIWRCGKDLKSLYYPPAEDTAPLDFNVQLDWEKSNYNLTAKVRVHCSRPLTGYQLWLRADAHVDHNILSRRKLKDGRNKWQFNETIPRAQFVMPGLTDVTALLVNNVGRIVARCPVKQVEVKPLNSPSMLIGFYQAWRGTLTENRQTFTIMPPQAQLEMTDSIKLDVGVQFISSKEMTVVFEPFLTDETEKPRWPLGKKVYRLSTSEIQAAATLQLVPFGPEVLSAAGEQADASTPVSLEDYLDIREAGNRVYIPPGQTYRMGFRLYVDGRLVEDRILYYDWLESVPQTVYIKPLSE